MIIKTYLSTFDIEIITRIVKASIPDISASQLEFVVRKISKIEIDPDYRSPEMSNRIIDVSTCPTCGAPERMTGIIETMPPIEEWECSNGHKREIQR